MLARFLSLSNRRDLRRAGAAALCTLVTACGGGKAASDTSTSVPTSSAPVASVTVPTLTAATLGANAQVTAQALDAKGAAVASATIAWSVADASIASVDSHGSVTPLRAGFTTITATVGSLSASGTVSVRGIAAPTRSKYVGINLTGIAYWTTQFPFVDLMKDSVGWSSRSDSGVWGAAFPSTKDGYPTALATGQHALAAVAWGNVHYAPGQYVVLWDGDGTISFPMTNGVAKVGDHRATLDMTDTTGPMWVGIDSTSATNPIRNVRFLWPGTESSYATQPFNAPFLNKIAPFSVVRYMDWGATNGSPVVEWADRSHVSDVTYANPNGVPIEVMIDLANTLHVDPWFCIPHMASDDYVRQFAALLHARLDPALKPHIEYSNEVWNTGFAQTVWANARSQALGLESPYGQPAVFYAVRSVQIFKLMQDAYGADKGRLVRVLAGQAAWDNFLTHTLAYQDTAANADVMAVAPYFSADAAGDPAQVATTLTLTSDQVVDQMLVSIRGPIKSWMTANAALASKYHLTLKAYESGSGNTTSYFPADKQAAMTALMQAANRNPRMKDVYGEYFTLWMNSGGDTMNQYSDIGNWGIWGNWGTLEYVTQDPATAPRYLGLLDFIARHPTP